MVKKKKFVQVPYKDNKIYVKSKIPFHVNYSMRLIFVFVSVIFIGLVLGNFTKQINDLYKASKFKINETGYINYEVLLNNNNFYSEKTLGMDMAYVPGLIDDIKLRFNYNFYSDEYLDVNYNNLIKYDFIILNNKDNSILYNSESNQVLTHKLFKDKSLKYADEVVIDYSKYLKKYNELAAYYGKDITGYLNVSNTIDKNSDMKVLDGYLDSDKVYSIKIPVSNSIFSIDLDENTRLKNEIEVYKDEELTRANSLLIVTTIILCALFVAVFLIFIKLISLLGHKMSKYDKFVYKLLRDYDSVIVETMVYPKTEGLNRINVKSFKEILDAHDLVKKPIMYYNVVNHMKCMFYVLDDKDLYVYTVKEVDLEK